MGIGVQGRRTRSSTRNSESHGIPGQIESVHARADNGMGEGYACPGKAPRTCKLLGVLVTVNNGVSLVRRGEWAVAEKDLGWPTVPYSIGFSELGNVAHINLPPWLNPPGFLCGRVWSWLSLWPLPQAD